MKLTKEQIKQILELRKRDKTYKEIAKIMGLNVSTVRYWLDDSYKDSKIKKSQKWYQNLSEEKKKEYNESQKEYRRDYYSKRYKTDSKFREYMIKKQTEYQKRTKKG